MTKHHFYSLTDRQGKAIRRALVLGLAALWMATLGAGLASVSLAESVSLPDLRDLSLTNWNCLPEGTPRNPAGASRHRMTNRHWSAVPAQHVPEADYAQFVSHAQAFHADG